MYRVDDQKRGNRDLYSPIGMKPSCKEVEILGVTFQECDSKFSVHVKSKLIKTNKSLHILRTLRKEGYNQSEIDLLFNTIVLPYIYLELRKPGQQTFCNFSQLPLSNCLFTVLFAYVVFFFACFVVRNLC